MCGTRLAENTRCKNYAIKRHLRPIAQLCLAIFAGNASIDNLKKLIKQQYLLHTSSEYELRLTNSWDWLVCLGHTSKFQRDSRLGFVTAPTSLNGSQPHFARCLAVSWSGTLCIHFWGLLSPNRILPGAKFTLRPSLAFSYIGSITARHSSSGRQPNFAAWYLHLLSAIPFDIGRSNCLVSYSFWLRNCPI